ncbi:MAG TPA: hypothetical protein VMX97_03325 [Hyphomicrobiaceae bacterium]|nr:hypothetical protein [Hyphomicrobiaceae bacterium]
MRIKSSDRVRHDRDRTVILQILLPKGAGCAMEFYELLDQADLHDRPMSVETLSFHVRYLADKGWLGFREETPPDSKVKAIRTVWITALGIDLVDDVR